MLYAIFCFDESPRMSYFVYFAASFWFMHPRIHLTLLHVNPPAFLCIKQTQHPRHTIHITTIGGHRKPHKPS